jgi:MtN3 and saliva related transmembrane protein
MDIQDLLGYIAATLTTAAFVPQAWKTFRSRDVSGISLGMYSLFTAGVALWLVYGLTLRNMPITVANAITLTLALAVLLMKLRYGQSVPPPDPDRDEAPRPRGD